MYMLKLAFDIGINMEINIPLITLITILTHLTVPTNTYTERDIYNREI